MKTSLIVCLVATLAVGAMAADLDGFEMWRLAKGKSYGSVEEYFYRAKIYNDNVEMINQHNAAKKSWYMSVNDFADLTAEEFRARYVGGLRKTGASKPYTPTGKPVAGNPSSVDWRQHGAVTPVKNQGQCGSCWAFSTTGSLEGAHQIKTGKLVAFSEQQLVDCASAEGNMGCNGGLMDQGFEYIIKEGGLCTEEGYPYTAANGSCNTGSCTEMKNLISGYKDVSQGDESALMAAVNKGPVSIAIEADQSGFQFYSGGVFSGNCGKQLDHGVLIVGYGTDAGQDYWTVKNSWGGSWGESGYIRLVRGKDQCGLADAASYPIAN